jgi:type II secretory pathway component PulF
VQRYLNQVYHNLSTLLDAGVPLLRTLETAGSGFGKMGGVLKEMRSSVRQGKDLAEAMAEHPKMFDGFDVAVVRVGETAGALPESFKMLGEWYDFKKRMRGIIISGSVYPLLLLHLGALVAPIPRLLLGSIVTWEYFQAVAGILALVYVPLTALFLFLKFRPRRGRVGLAFDEFTLGIPVLGKAVKQLGISRFTRAFHIMCRAGIPYLQGIEMAMENTPNMAVAQMFAQAAEQGRRGEGLYTGLSQRLPEYYRNLWEIGEESGELDEVTGRLARTTGESAETWFAELAKWLPRIMYFIIMGIMVYLILSTASSVVGSYR